MTMTVLELLQCFFWGALAVIPITLALFAGEAMADENKANRTEGSMILWIAIFLQIAYGVAAFKAGMRP